MPRHFEFNGLSEGIEIRRARGERVRCMDPGDHAEVGREGEGSEGGNSGCLAARALGFKADRPRDLAGRAGFREPLQHDRLPQRALRPNRRSRVAISGAHLQRALPGPQRCHPVRRLIPQL